MSMDTPSPTPIDQPKPKRKRGNPAWVKGGSSPNPGGGVLPERKPVRKTLLELWYKPNEAFTPRTNGERVAWEYFREVFDTKPGTSDHRNALERLASRLDVDDTPGAASAQPVPQSNNLVMLGKK